jgi:hypothetical protein
MAPSAIALGTGGTAGHDHRLVRAPGPLSTFSAAWLRAAAERLAEPVRPRPCRTGARRQAPGLLVRVNGHWYPAGGSFDQPAADRPRDARGGGN